MQYLCVKGHKIGLKEEHDGDIFLYVFLFSVGNGSDNVNHIIYKLQRRQWTVFLVMFVQLRWFLSGVVQGAVEIFQVVLFS